MGRKPQSELDGPPFPGDVEYLWMWFSELQRTRQMGQYGMQALTYTELEAWARVTGRDPSPDEVGALFDIDDAVRRALSDG